MYVGVCVFLLYVGLCGVCVRACVVCVLVCVLCVCVCVVCVRFVSVWVCVCDVCVCVCGWLVCVVCVCVACVCVVCVRVCVCVCVVCVCGVWRVCVCLCLILYDLGNLNNEAVQTRVVLLAKEETSIFFLSVYLFCPRHGATELRCIFGEHLSKGRTS